MQTQKLSTGPSKIKHHFSENSAYSISKQPLLLGVLRTRPLFQASAVETGWFWEADPRAETGPWLFVMTPNFGARRTPGDHHGGHAPTSADWEIEAWGVGVTFPSHVVSVMKQGLEPWSLGSHPGLLIHHYPQIHKLLTSSIHFPSTHGPYVLNAVVCMVECIISQAFWDGENSSGFPLTISVEPWKYRLKAISIRGFVVRCLTSTRKCTHLV